MPGAKIRKIAIFLDETHIEMGQTIDPPTRRAAAVAVIENPFASVYQEDLEDLMEIGAELGGLLGEKCVAALGIEPSEAESYGKAAMVGENGELEHAAPGDVLGESVGGAGNDHDVDQVIEELEEADRAVLDDLTVRPRRLPEALAELGEHGCHGPGSYRGGWGRAVACRRWSRRRKGLSAVVNHVLAVV